MWQCGRNLVLTTVTLGDSHTLGAGGHNSGATIVSLGDVNGLVVKIVNDVGVTEDIVGKDGEDIWI